MIYECGDARNISEVGGECVVDVGCGGVELGKKWVKIR